MSDFLPSLRFHRKPSPVLPEHRPLYKIAQLLLVLECASRAGKSSLPRLHLLNWALKNGARVDRLFEALNRNVLGLSAWGFDPALAIAIRYAIAEDLVRESTAGGVEITEKGVWFAKEIGSDSVLLVREKAELARLGKGVTEAMVKKAAKEWGQ